jgi:hypothetical protein
LSASLSLLLFSNLGGLGFTHLFDARHRNDPRRDWIHDWGHGQIEYWFHPIMHIIIPQRAALWSIPVCIWTILLLAIGVEHSDPRLFFLAAILTGFLPQLQIHGYVAIAQYAISLAIVTFDRRKFRKFSRFWLLYGIVANLIAFPQLSPYFRRVSNAKREFLRWNPIWKTGQKSNLRFPPVVLWWRGLGVFGAVALVFGWAVATKWQITLYVPALVVFVIANFVRYQPWELDNTKLFYAAWIPLAVPFVAQFFTALVARPKSMLGKCAGGLLMGVFVVSCGLSALMSTVQSMFWPTSMFGHHDYRFGLWMAENTPPNAVVMFHSAPGNTVACIAGRQMFMGFGGWVVSHGLDGSRGSVEVRLYRV